MTASSETIDAVAPAFRLVPATLADRLFAPHGAPAYLRWLEPGPRRKPLATPGHVQPDTRETRVRTAEQLEPDGDRSGSGEGAEVTFVRSGTVATASGTLLETAEQAGLTPRHRCRRGICGTCTSDLVSGTVCDTRTAETQSGPAVVKLCVSLAEGPVSLDL